MVDSTCPPMGAPGPCVARWWSCGWSATTLATLRQGRWKRRHAFIGDGAKPKKEGIITHFLGRACLNGEALLEFFLGGFERFVIWCSTMFYDIISHFSDCSWNHVFRSLFMWARELAAQRNLIDNHRYRYIYIYILWKQAVFRKKRVPFFLSHEWKPSILITLILSQSNETIKFIKW